MTPGSWLAAALLALAAGAGLAGAASAVPPPAAPASPTGAVEVTFDRSRVTAAVGDRFTLESRIANPGSAPTDRLLAHLNVASLTSDVYVDPEDWSPSRSQELGPLGARDRTSVRWDIQAVNAGSFDVYVVLLPDGSSSAGTGPLVVSPPVHVEVAGRRTLTAGGALPVVVVVPVLLGLLAGAIRLRVKRAR